MPMSLALSVCVLFISLMQLVNEAQFLIIISFIMFAAAPAAALFGTVIVALTSTYMHHYNHIKLNLALKF